MKKRTVFIMATALVIVLVSFVGAILWDGNASTNPVTDQLSGETAVNMETEILLQFDTQKTDTEDESCVMPVQTHGSEQDASDKDRSPQVSPSAVAEKDSKKEYVDNSPENRAAELIRHIAESAAWAESIIKEKDELESRRADIISSVKGNTKILAASESAELKRIDDRLAEIWLNHGSVIENPDLYNEEVYFKDMMDQTILFNQTFLEYSFEPGTYEYWQSEGLVRLATECLEKYEAGEDLDDIYLFYFRGIDELGERCFMEASGK